MTKIVYSDHYKVEGSSVISDLYYREVPGYEGNGELYVQLKRDGVLCGYSAPREVYRALVLNAQDDEGSVGQYWNHFVKDHYEGFPTTDIELVAPRGWTLNDVSAAEPVQVTILPVNPPEATQTGQRRFVINAAVAKEVEQVVYANDLTEALRLFNQKMQDEEYASVRIVSATQFFD